jgi:hypothetical protein
MRRIGRAMKIYLRDWFFVVCICGLAISWWWAWQDSREQFVQRRMTEAKLAAEKANRESLSKQNARLQWEKADLEETIRQLKPNNPAVSLR